MLHLPSSAVIYLHLPSSACLFHLLYFTFICPRLPSCIISFISFIRLHLPLSVFICLDHPSFPFIALSFIFTCYYLPSSSFCLMSSCTFICLHFPSWTFILFPYLPSFASSFPSFLPLSAFISFHLPSFTFIRPSFALHKLSPASI